MSRIPLIVVAGLLALSGSAQACSLAYQPFDQPSWDGDLRYVDGNSLRSRDGDRDVELQSGFFITYAVNGDTLVVSGQQGLGADCSGEGWLRVVRGDQVIRAEAGMHKVFDHPDGAIVVKDSAARLLPWDGAEDEPLPSVPRDTWVDAWSPARHPAYDDRGTYHAGARELQLPSGARTQAAPGPEGTGVLVLDGGVATLYTVPDAAAGEARMRSWSAGEDWATGLSWAGAWYAVAAGELYRVGDGVERIDIGAEVVSVTARGNQAVAFHQDGYVVLDGTTAVGGAELDGTTWTETFPSVSVHKVSSTDWRQADGWSEPPEEAADGSTTNGGPGDTDDPGPVETVPFITPALVVVAFAALAARRGS